MSHSCHIICPFCNHTVFLVARTCPRCGTGVPMFYRRYVEHASPTVLPGIHYSEQGETSEMHERLVRILED